ncbi:hypothetical protein [Pseudomonas sp. SIMBA_068]|uniref:hypothetical protein n=1 Tax=Pseudomonas sp. SIMBA_068 TaxID=3085808 RepID=UPI0039795C3B
MNWECFSYWIEHHPGLASWVQAIGSIGAIGIAIWIASSQRRAEARADRAKSKLVLDLIKTVAARADRAVSNDSVSSMTLNGHLNLIAGLYTTLEKIDLLNLPAENMLEPMCNLRDALRALEAGMREAQRKEYLATWLSQGEAILWKALVKTAAKQIAGLK